MSFKALKVELKMLRMQEEGAKSMFNQLIITTPIGMFR
jgi:hypothetical protein